MKSVKISANALGIIILLLWQHFVASNITNVQWLKLSSLSMREIVSLSFKEVYAVNRIRCAAVALSTTGSLAYCYDQPQCIVALAEVDLYDIFGQDPGKPLCWLDRNQQIPPVWGGASNLTVGLQEDIYSHAGYGTVAYSLNYTVKWLFQAPVGYKVHLLIASFSTEQNFDYLDVRDGGTRFDALMETVTGNQTDLEFTTTGNLLFLYFYSDYSNIAPGWEATVDAV